VSVFGEASPRRHHLGQRLRELRRHADLTGVQLAERLEIGQSTISRYELGQDIPPPDVIDRWAAAVGATGEQHAELADLAEIAETEAVVWRRRGHRGVVGRQQETADMEASAGRLLSFQPILIHGLLQVPAYARATFEAFWVDGQPDIEGMVRARMARQALLQQEGRRFAFLTSEAGLRWRMAPPEVMAAQLERLQETLGRPGVSLGVVPLELPRPIWHSHGFTVFADRVGGAETVVHVETLTSGINVRNPADVARFEEAFERLRRVAVTGEQARALLERIMRP
jgi:transcriptional regulator with XRE-family HTH domain